MAMRNWGSRLRMAPWRITRGTPVPRFTPESVRAHHTALAFSLLFQAIKRNDVLTSLSVSRSEQRAGQAQTETQTKKIPHTRLPISLRTLPPLAARDGVWCVCHSTGEDGRRQITVSLEQIGRGAHLGTGMRRRPIYFPFFFFSTCWFTVYGPGVRADRERLLISPLLEDKKLVYYNRKVDRYYYGHQIRTKCHKIVKKRNQPISSSYSLSIRDNQLSL